MHFVPTGCARMPWYRDDWGQEPLHGKAGSRTVEFDLPKARISAQFAHPGEKARRRDPKLYNYAGIACPDMKKVRLIAGIRRTVRELGCSQHPSDATRGTLQAGFCARGDKCPYAHNVFEFWLHPTRYTTPTIPTSCQHHTRSSSPTQLTPASRARRYRTQLCNDGQNCTRNVCFFAHTLEEMRAAPGKLVEAKKDGRRGGIVSPRPHLPPHFSQQFIAIPNCTQAGSEPCGNLQLSPDTPFIHSGSSLATTSSTGSAEVWGIVGPDADRRRSSGILPDEGMAKVMNTLFPRPQEHQKERNIL